jgi:hypothetical protein
MEDSDEQYDALIRSGAKRLNWIYQRRSFQAEWSRPYATAMLGKPNTASAGDAKRLRRGSTSG